MRKAHVVVVVKVDDDATAHTHYFSNQIRLAISLLSLSLNNSRRQNRSLIGQHVVVCIVDEHGRLQKKKDQLLCYYDD